MIILVSSKISQTDIQASLGKPEYSYFFLMKEFLPALEQIGEVIAVNDADEIVALTALYRAEGKTAVFLSFSPPHQVPLNLPCPTVAVFAWEFDSIPVFSPTISNDALQGDWESDPRNDWRYVFERIAGAVATSRETATLVEQSMAGQFPVIALPAPVWSRYAAITPMLDGQPNLEERAFSFAGQLIDTHEIKLNANDVAFKPISEVKRINNALFAGWWHEVRLPKRSKVKAPPLATPNNPSSQLVALNGVVYTTVLAPKDGRKNWKDIVSAFCWAFKDVTDATLLVKMTHHDMEYYHAVVLKLLARLSPFSCRVLVVHGFLSDNEYLQLIRASTYYVNASTGEGLCLPLMEFLCCGKPAIAPAHTAMADYLSEDFAFLVKTSIESACWPHDPAGMLLTHSHRLNWQSLMEAFRTSYQTAKQPSSYQLMSTLAHRGMQDFCSVGRVSGELGAFLQKVTASATQDPMHSRVGIE